MDKEFAIISVIRMLLMANEEQLNFIYHFLLHCIRDKRGVTK